MNKNSKAIQEIIRKINSCYQVYNYKLEICFPLPNGCYLSFVTYYQDATTEIADYKKQINNK